MIRVRCICDGHDHELVREIVVYECPSCGLFWSRLGDCYYPRPSLNTADAD